VLGLEPIQQQQLEVDNNGSRIHIESDTNNIWNGNYTTLYDVTDSQWHHLVLVFGSSASYLYVDGDLHASAGANTDTADFRIRDFGIRQHIATGYPDYYIGDMDEVQIFEYPLTLVQVKNLYNASSAVYYGPTSGEP